MGSQSVQLNLPYQAAMMGGQPVQLNLPYQATMMGGQSVQLNLPYQASDGRPTCRVKPALSGQWWEANLYS